MSAVAEAAIWAVVGAQLVMIAVMAGKVFGR